MTPTRLILAFLIVPALVVVSAPLAASAAVSSFETGYLGEALFQLGIVPREDQEGR